VEKAIFLATLFLFLVLVGSNVNAFTLEDGVEILPSGSDTVYEINAAVLTFDTFDTETNAPYFNGHIFHIEPDTGSATVKINSWNPPTMEFEVTATDEIIAVLGGFTFGERHGIYVDGVHWQNRDVTSSGTLSFIYPHFSSHTFSIGDYIVSSPAGAYQPAEDEEYRPTVTTPSYEEIDWTVILLSAGVIFIIWILIIFFCRKN